jgi:hypothetical protein
MIEQPTGPLEVDVNDGQWHRHNGGPMPVQVHERSIVQSIDIFKANSQIVMASSSLASNTDWADACAYRVTKAHVEPPKPREFWLRPEYTVVLTSPPEIVGSFEYIHVREVMTDDI